MTVTREPDMNPVPLIVRSKSGSPVVRVKGEIEGRTGAGFSPDACRIITGAVRPLTVIEPVRAGPGLGCAV